MCQSHMEAWATNMAAALATECIQDYIHPDDETLQSTIEMTPGLKPFTYVTLHRTLMLKVKARARHAFTLKQKNLF